MFLTYLMLAVALSLSVIAAFYSIVGLAAIFAAAVIPIVIMGSILEIAKLTVTVWLHEYWRQCRWAMKMYLVPAVGILMLITSMGIFGFLSKAHLDQAVPAGDISAQVAIFDEKIKTQRDNIEAARTALRQMDAQVDQVLGRTTDDKGAERAVQIRRQQAAERNRLQADISRAQAEIVKLNEQRAPVAAQARKVEAEVGPIKYIAALIYGDNPDANLLEKAVRWVIITLVTVFDPLAIFMLLAATESWKWERARRQGMPSPDQPVNDAVDKSRAWAQDVWQRLRRKPHANMDDVAIVTKNLDERSTGSDLDHQSVAKVVAKPVFNPAIEYRVLDDADEEGDPDEFWDIDDDEEMRDAKRRWKADNPETTLKAQRKLVSQGRIDHEPWLDYLTYQSAQSSIAHGDTWPDIANRGDLFIRTDSQPTVLYKYIGTKWIQVSKSSSDTYAHHAPYIDYLIAQISQGQYDPELLTDAEREEIESRLKKDIT